MSPVHYVSDYEEVTGLKIPAEVEIKVIGTPAVETVQPAIVAETKA